MDDIKQQVRDILKPSDCESLRYAVKEALIDWAYLLSAMNSDDSVKKHKYIDRMNEHFRQLNDHV